MPVGIINQSWYSLYPSQHSTRNCINCCDVDVLGGFLAFGDGDDHGLCEGCGRTLMGTFSDLRAFRTKFRGVPTSAPQQRPTSIPEHRHEDEWEDDDDDDSSAATAAKAQSRRGRQAASAMHASARQKHKFHA